MQRNTHQPAKKTMDLSEVADVWSLGFVLYLTSEQLRQQARGSWWYQNTMWQNQTRAGDLIFSMFNHV